MRPNVRIFAKRRSISLTRSPYSEPGAMRFTVAVGALFDRLRPSDGEITAFGADQFAASVSPWSLLSVPPTWTPSFGGPYDPRAVYRVMKPVFVLQYGFVGLAEPRIDSSGKAAWTPQ